LDTLAFIDETGNVDLDTSKQNVSKYFIVCALIIDSDKYESVKQQAENVRKYYFQTGEIKSSNIKDKDNHSRRIKILKSILDIDFKFYALAVDKNAIQKDGGLRFKKPFFKFINGILYKQLFQNFPTLTAYADEHGNEEFQKSFITYIEKNHKHDLFWKSEIHLVSSKQNVIVQLSDFIAGTLAKVYEGKSNPALDEAYRELLTKKALGLKEWPTKYQAVFENDKTSEVYDQFIHTHALSKAESFIEERNNNNDEEVRLQVCTLKYLAFQSRLATEDKYISTNTIIEHLISSGFVNISEQLIRSTIVSKLRDHDVIIASCNRGYKLPSSYSDLHDFVDRVDSLIMPLLRRLNKARKSYLIASKGDVDLLKGPKYPELVEFLHILDKQK